MAKEITAGGRDAFGIEVFEQASWLDISPEPLDFMPYLQNTLDSGEASVIQTALQLGIIWYALMDYLAGARRVCQT